MVQDKDFLELMTLAYFRDHKNDYSLNELADFLGISIRSVADIIDVLMDEKSIIKDGAMLVLSFEGRMKLNNSDQEMFSFIEVEQPVVIFNPSLSLDDVYVPIGFSKKKWNRNSFVH